MLIMRPREVPTDAQRSPEPIKEGRVTYQNKLITVAGIPQTEPQRSPPPRKDARVAGHCGQAGPVGVKFEGNRAADL